MEKNVRALFAVILPKRTDSCSQFNHTSIFVIYQNKLSGKPSPKYRPLSHTSFIWTFNVMTKRRGIHNWKLFYGYVCNNSKILEKWFLRRVFRWPWCRGLFHGSLRASSVFSMFRLLSCTTLRLESEFWVIIENYTVSSSSLMVILLANTWYGHNNKWFWMLAKLWYWIWR